MEIVLEIAVRTKNVENGNLFKPQIYYKYIFGFVKTFLNI